MRLVTTRKGLTYIGGREFLCFFPLCPPSRKKHRKKHGMEKRIRRVTALEEHLKDHPTDYQAVIALLKARSDMIEHRVWLKMVERKRRVAEIRKRRKERESNEESSK